MTKKKTAVSRRRFLKEAGVTAGAAAAVAPAGASALVGEAAAAPPDADIRLAPEFEPSRAAPVPERTWPMTAANVFAECCKAEGLAAFIHCPGNYAVQNALAEAGIPSYGGRHDGHMGHACDAFYRVTGEIAAINAQWGGCLAMGMSPFTIAHSACSPILILSGAGRVSDEDTGRRKGMVAGTWRDQWMTTGVTKWGKTILTADRVWEHTAEAFRQMKTGIPGSTHLIFPNDVLAARFESPRELSYHYDKAKYRTEASPHPEPKAVTAAIDMLRKAERPMIVCGQGVFAKKAWDELKTFAERMQIPVTEAAPQKGTFADDHPLSASAAPDSYGSVDVVLVVGHYRMPPLGQWAFPFNAKYIRIHPVPEEIGRDIPIDVGIVSCEKAALQALNDEAPRMSRDSWIAEVRAAEEKYNARRDEIYAQCRPYSEPGAVHPAAIARAVGDFLHDGDIPRDEMTIVSGGYGIARYTRQYLRAYRPGQILNGPYWEIVVGPDIAYTLGVGVAMELGAGPQAAHRGAPILTITGDAGFGITGLEMETLAKYRIPAIVVVYNNNAWGTWSAQRGRAGSSDRPRKEHLHLFQENLRYDKVGEALGCHGEYVTEAAEVLPALRRAYDVAVNDRLPTVLNVQGKKEFWDGSVYPPAILGKVEPGVGAYSY